MKNRRYLFALLMLLSIGFFACNQSANDAKQGHEEKTGAEETEMFIYDPDKGAHIVAPDMTKILEDTLGVVIYELTMEPGDTLPWHEHPYHTSYILEGGTLEIIYGDGKSKIREFPTGRAGLGSPFGDIAINKGETTIKILMHELYSLEVSN